MMTRQADLDTLDIDDLYKNLRVNEQEVMGGSTATTQSIGFLSAENKIGTYD